MHRGVRRVLDHINLDVHPGQKLGILGRNGAGKFHPHQADRRRGDANLRPDRAQHVRLVGRSRSAGRSRVA